ncbi:DUF3850 domain-containing protein [uncultured Lactobacillus sp.]|uniref:DUF3850 domain-containing protein n=1 Tax=uncultured Lactobacillus sp. TaxID=153152 RepID=UPI002639B636|nr:DUF3850 domain-containing protein [uncultured Lactobacillus sp.]
MNKEIKDRYICLKIYPEFYKAQSDGIKNFEIRKNDKGFKVGDILILLEFDPNKKKYTKRGMLVKITYITDYAQKDDYEVLGTRVLDMTETIRAMLDIRKLKIDLHGASIESVYFSPTSILHELKGEKND